MTIHQTQWDKLKMNDVQSDDPLWELFHENSKLDPYQPLMSHKQVYQHIVQLNGCLNYDSSPKIALSTPALAPAMSLADAIEQRQTLHKMCAMALDLAHLGSLLHYSYGVTRSNQDSGVPRPFRAVPSAGGLYPLEIYIATTSHVKDLAPGLYHYNSEGHFLSQLEQTEAIEPLSAYFMQQDMIKNCSVLIMITALFQRTVFKYDTRGYRYVLLEAGHLGQNLALTATAFDMGVVTLGGFNERKIDSYLHIDGVNHSTLYALAIGRQ